MLSSDRLLRYFLNPMGRRRKTNVWLHVWNRMARFGEPTQNMPGDEIIDQGNPRDLGPSTLIGGGMHFCSNIMKGSMASMSPVAEHSGPTRD